ncbi:MAG: methyltransferase domain-containing protein [Nanoarchaeota archaeon]|nr:methyltransferase domain-containing protein [Nanoarchaeota archaeon]
MKLVLLLSGENLELAREEALAVAETKSYKQDKNVLTLETENDLRRLAFTRIILQQLFSCKTKDLEKQAQNFNWQEVYKENFCVRIKGKTELTEKSLASIIWRKLTNPRVDLENPKTNIHFLFTEKNVHCGLLLYENKEKFRERRPHLREGFHPTSMQPKLARALVNLSGIKKGQTILDPFCGTGGILIEAGLIGCKLKGNDIDPNMLELTKKNLKHFKLKAELIQKDALLLNTKADAIVTDLPYGKGSYHNISLETLYRRFLEKSCSMLKPNKRLVAVFPKKIRAKKLKIIKELESYVHSSLTRHIIIAKK